MVETGFKLIPSKKTRLNMMVILEAFAVGFLLISFFQLVGMEQDKTFVADVIALFIAWADFTKWNVGIYAASETVVKGAEAGMNR